jgi:hypothetical protein
LWGLVNGNGELMIARHLYWDGLHELVCCFHAGDCGSEGWTNTVQPRKNVVAGKRGLQSVCNSIDCLPV